LPLKRKELMCPIFGAMSNFIRSSLHSPLTMTHLFYYLKVELHPKYCVWIGDTFQSSSVSFIGEILPKREIKIKKWSVFKKFQSLEWEKKVKIVWF